MNSLSDIYYRSTLIKYSDHYYKVYKVHNANRIKSAALVSMFFEYYSEGT